MILNSLDELPATTINIKRRRDPAGCGKIIVKKLGELDGTSPLVLPLRTITAWAVKAQVLSLVFPARADFFAEHDCRNHAWQYRLPP